MRINLNRNSGAVVSCFLLPFCGLQRAENHESHHKYKFISISNCALHHNRYLTKSFNHYCGSVLRDSLGKAKTLLPLQLEKQSSTERPTPISSPLPFFLLCFQTSVGLLLSPLKSIDTSFRRKRFYLIVQCVHVHRSIIQPDLLVLPISVR